MCNHDSRWTIFSSFSCMSDYCAYNSGSSRGQRFNNLGQSESSPYVVPITV
jgi:hypothetical protein